MEATMNKKKNRKQKGFAGRTSALSLWLVLCLAVTGVLGNGYTTKTAQAAVSEDGQYQYEMDAAGNAVLTAYLGQETEITVPATVNGITVTTLSGTFQNKNQITKVTLPSSVATVNDTAFAGCYALQEFIVDLANPTLCNNEDGALFSKDMTVLYRYPVGKHLSSGLYRIPASVTNVAGYAFEGYNTQNIEIPANVRVIGDYAFANTRNFNGVSTWEEGTQLIGTYAFYKCTNLTLTEKGALPSTVNTIGVYAFAECSNIQIDISKTTITEIADYLFYNCDNLHNLTLPQTVVTVGAYAFSECNNLNEVVLDDNVRSIKEGAFAQCGNLHTIKIPEGVTAIENNTFNGCQNLNTVELPSTLQTIGDGAFAGCQNIHSINIPEGVTYISNTSFEGVDTSKIAFNIKVDKTKLKSAKRKGKKKVKLTWKKVDGATGYVVYRSQKKGKGYKKIKEIKGASKCSYLDKKAKKGKKYFYKVKVYKSLAGIKSYSGFSNMKAVKK